MSAANSRITMTTARSASHGGEDAAFSSYDSIAAAAVKDRIRDIGKNPVGAEELKVLKHRIAALKKQNHRRMR